MQQQILLALFTVAVSWHVCLSQYVYGGLLVRRPPPVRRSAIEALERLRLPPARYFPQVDNQVASYSGGALPYQWTSDVYALPPQWTDEGDLEQPQEDEDEYQGNNYEYEAVPYSPPLYRPAPPPFSREVYPQESSSMYRDDDKFQQLPRWPMTEGGQEETFVQRRNGPQEVVENKTSFLSTQSPVQQVQMTAVPSSPEKKNVKSLVLSDPISDRIVDSSWRGGQKEEPLFRPLQTSQRTTWEAKNNINKSPIPLLKQMISSGPKSSVTVDPLLEELSNLKKSHV